MRGVRARRRRRKRRSQWRFKKNRGGEREKMQRQTTYCKGYNVSRAVNGKEERGRKTGSAREECCTVPKREKRLEVKEATVSTEYENQNNSMKEMSRGGEV